MPTKLHEFLPRSMPKVTISIDPPLFLNQRRSYPIAQEGRPSHNQVAPNLKSFFGGIRLMMNSKKIAPLKHHAVGYSVQLRRAIVRRVIHGALAGRHFSIISSNCLGSRLSTLAGDRFRSPTVDLWFEPGDFVRFCHGLREYVRLELRHAELASDLAGYPIAYCGDVKLHLLHYSSFEDGASAWARRAGRIDFERLLFVFTDRDHANDDHFRSFDELPFPKLLFSARALPYASCVHIKNRRSTSCVPDLFWEYQMLWPALSAKRLRMLSGAAIRA